MKRLFPLMLVLGLAACGDKPDDATATVAATTDTAAPAAEPVATPADETPAPADAATTDADPTEAASAEPAPVEAAPADDKAPPAEATADQVPPAPPAPTPPPEMPDPANAPREGIDYVVLAEPVPTFGQGGIEVAEVFAYTCIHCANLQPLVDNWRPTLPADVRFIYVPGVFGGASDNFARGYYAAEALGILDKTHSKLFSAVLVDQKFKTGSEEEIADWYATEGADAKAFLSTMQSFSVSAKLNRARQFALRGNVDATPTMIIAGKYSASTTRDRGPEGLLATIDWLVARERAMAAKP